MQFKPKAMPSPPKARIAEPGDKLPPDEVLFGRSAAMQEIRRLAFKVCQTDVPVLLCGNGGTGKEAIARWIHKHSPFASGQFVKVNCAAVPAMLLESELFGYEKGAFSGAQVAKQGKVELARNGTLFLDEIADLDGGLQAKLLHFLQDGGFSRIGGTEDQNVRTRLICATSRKLEHEIETGEFRADLYHRINVVRMHLPKLCARKDDIPLLAEYFWGQFQEKFAKAAEPVCQSMMQRLQNLDWPGNIRELSNSIARHVLLGTEANIGFTPAAKPQSNVSALLNGRDCISLKELSKEAVRERERALILQALEANHWNRRRAAETLKISYGALIYKIREAGFGAKRTKSTPDLGNQVSPPNPATQ